MQTTTQTNAENVVAATAKAIARAIALARTANNASATDAERASATEMLASHCAKHNLNIADIIARAAQADPTASEARRRRATSSDKPEQPKAKPEPKPETAKAKPETAKPEQPTKPHADTKAAKSADYEKRVALIDELRASCSAVYNGPSLAIRRDPKRVAIGAYAELHRAPKHRTTLDRVSVRDESALREIIMRGTKAGAFNPSEINLDLGIFSRISSVGFVDYDDGTFSLSKAGIAHARNVFKRAA